MAAMKNTGKSGAVIVTVKGPASMNLCRRSFIHRLRTATRGFLTDFSTNEAKNLREEREINAKPYFIMEQAPNIIGWRHSPGERNGQHAASKAARIYNYPRRALRK